MSSWPKIYIIKLSEKIVHGVMCAFFLIAYLLCQPSFQTLRTGGVTGWRRISLSQPSIQREFITSFFSIPWSQSKGRKMESPVCSLPPPFGTLIKTESNSKPKNLTQLLLLISKVSVPMSNTGPASGSRHNCTLPPPRKPTSSPKSDLETRLITGVTRPLIAARHHRSPPPPPPIATPPPRDA